MSTTLQKARAALKKNKKVDFKNRVELDPNNSTPVDVISTGSVVLDFMIGGNRLVNGQRQCPGIPRGSITEIYGPEGSGKTTVALETAVKCQEEGGTVCFLDYENAISPSYARSLGVDFSEDKFELFTPITWEEGAEIIKVMTQAGVDLIIVDSVSAMVPQATFEKDPSEPGQIGLLARLQSHFLPNIVHDLRINKTALVYLNQLRSRIKTSRYDTGPDETTSGGRALKYYCSLRMSLKRIKTEYQQVENTLTGDSDKQPVCNIVRAQCTKNKVSMHQGHTATFALRYGEGIDTVRSVIDIGVSRNVVKQAGSWYTFVDQNGAEQKHQGVESLREYLFENDAAFMHLVSEISAFSAESATPEPDAPKGKIEDLDGGGDEVIADPAVVLEEFDSLEDMVLIAEGQNIIWQAGPWFKFKDASEEEQSVRGREALLALLRENPEMAEYLMTQVTTE